MGGWVRGGTGWCRASSRSVRTTLFQEIFKSHACNIIRVVVDKWWSCGMKTFGVFPRGDSFFVLNSISVDRQAGVGTTLVLLRELVEHPVEHNIHILFQLMFFCFSFVLLLFATVFFYVFFVSCVDQLCTATPIFYSHRMTTTTKNFYSYFL